MKPRIGIIPGDPSGIGPELVARLLAADGVVAAADILLIGDRHVFAAGQHVAGTAHDLVAVDPDRDAWRAADAVDAVDAVALLEMHTIDPDAVRVAELSRASGRSVLKTLDKALALAAAGGIDAILFAPFNKGALHAAGMTQEDELTYMAATLGVETYTCELNMLDGIWTSRVTSHIALRAVADMITEDRICAAVDLIDATLRRAGIARPRIAVAAINPHAGDNGNFGREEIDIIRPAVERMAARQMAVDGPWPSDTVFLKAFAGEVDAVVTMYHDQGQIALKLKGFDRGVSVQGGLPYPVCTPSHGTAFDIAGQGRADAGAMLGAFTLACAMAQTRSVPP